MFSHRKPVQMIQSPCITSAAWEAADTEGARPVLLYCIAIDSSPGLLMFNSIDWTVHLAGGMADVIHV